MNLVLPDLLELYISGLVNATKTAYAPLVFG